MRTTGNMLINNMVNYISVNQQRMEKFQYQLATGKKIRVPSDDPVVAARALKLRTDVSELAQYKRNLNDAQSWLQITETAVSNMGDILHRANELAVQAANGSNTQSDTNKIKVEVEQLRSQYIQTANTNYNGRYVFSGFQTDKPLLNSDGSFAINVGMDENIKYQVAVGDDLDINVTGGDVLNDPPSNAITTSPSPTVPTIIQYFDKFITELGNGPANVGPSIGDLQKAMDNVLRVRSDIGARSNRIELTMNRLEEANINFTDIMSKNEDVDEAETIMLMKNEENVYRASLAAGARIIQPSLVDFLR